MTPESRVWLIAACYGLWAGFCAVATITVISALWLGLWNSTRSTFGDFIEFLPYAAFTVIVASLGWAMLHLRRRQPGPGAYIALAIAVVVIVHAVLMYEDSAPPGYFLVAMSVGLVIHCWFTMPIAAGATGLFVWFLKRWKAI